MTPIDRSSTGERRNSAMSLRQWRKSPKRQAPSASERRFTGSAAGGAAQTFRDRTMTGMLEHELPGLGHNKPSDEDADAIKHAKWERWSRKRTFVRALEGTYSHLYKKLLEEPRVYSSKDHP